ncbi:transglycosylase domain-containing protein [Cystobacter fuscus]
MGRRLLVKVTTGANLAGDGSCERKLAMRLAMALGIEEPLQQTVAAHRLHSFLQKDQLIAYDLASVYFERGVVGVDDAVYKLFGKELDALELSQLAELSLTLPPHGFYVDAVQCRNESIIRQNRDVLLADLADYKLVTVERARNAMAQPVTCRR